MVAGVAAGLAHPPFGVLPGLLGYALLLALIDGGVEARPLRSAFFRAWLGGVGYFSVCVWWIVEPFMVDAKEQGWMAPFALILMAGGLAVFWGLAAVLYRALKTPGAARVLVFAGCLAGFEWLRGNIFTGFPWDLPGETWTAGSAPSQIASVIGAYGLTWITLAIAASPAVLAAPLGRLSKGAAIAAAALALAGLYGFGFARLQHTALTAPGAPIVRVVQADIDQKEKWRPENLSMVFDTYARLTDRPAATRPAIV
ncbi:MAG: apolipoprotein N-acyltransferase, partial [Phenylobacterium sp.]